MRSVTRLVLIVALVLTCVGALSAQQTQKSKSGSISGRVTMGNKGVAGVMVTISTSADAMAESGLKLSAVTDDEGRYRLSNLTPTSYFVWPFVPAFVVAEGSGVFPHGKNVLVREGESADDVNFTLTRGGVITGKVTDSTGRPIADELIRLFPVQRDLRRLISSVYQDVNSIVTDDRGIYRAYGLPAGTYRVAVGEAQFAAFNSTGGRRVYPQTFHPDVTDEAKAELVEVTEGGEVKNVDITVARTMPGFSVSGRFVDAGNGQPVPSISFGLTILSDPNVSRGFVSLRNVSTSNGMFQIDNLPPGTYAVSVLDTARTGYYGASDSFAIRDSDLTDIEIKVHRGSKVAGNVIVEGTDNRSMLSRLSRMQIQAYTWGEGNAVGAISYADINADGSFEVGPLRAGKLSILLAPRDRNAPADFLLLAIEQNGIDRSQEIQLKEGENISGLRLIAGYGTGIIRGTVKFEGGTLPSGTHMDALIIRPGSSFTIGHTLVDARGQFVFERMPPGNYEVGVNAYLSGGRVSGRQVVVTSNGVPSEITVTLNLSQSPKP